MAGRAVVGTQGQKMFGIDSALERVLSVMASRRLSALRHVVGRTAWVRAIAAEAQLDVGSALLSLKLAAAEAASTGGENNGSGLKLSTSSVYWPGRHLELAVSILLRRFCVAGSVFYDIGANQGMYSFEIGKRLGANGMVFAFEADHSNCVAFQMKASQLKLQSRIELIESAVWSHTSSDGLPFRHGREAAHGGVVADGVDAPLADDDVQRVRAINLDDFLRQGNPAPTVIKIDVEGGECEVLKGGESLFSHSIPKLICEIHSERSARWIELWLASKGYEAQWLIPREDYPRVVVGQRRRLDSSHCAVQPARAF